ncbi:retrovirus-related pol polyprotein from transposon TNT 1-94 [Tanacetum coccineum]
MSSECNNIKLAIHNDKSKVVCAMCKQCLITSNHDVCVLNYVNDMNSRDDNHSENVSNSANHKKHMPKVKKPKKSRSKESLTTPKPRKPRTCLKWSLTGRTFDLKGKLIESSDSECQSDSSKGDNACTSNLKELISKRFPNSTSFLGRSKDEALEEIKTFLKKITVLLQAPVIIVRTKNDTEFKNQVLKEYFDSVGISHQMLKQLLLRATLKTAPSFTDDLTKHHISLLTAENRISHFYMYLRLFVISRMIVRTLGNLMQKQQDNQAQLQPETIVGNAPNAMFDGDVFENPFAPPNTSAAESSSSQYVDPLNMHMFYQPYPHEYQWTKDHPLEQVIGEPSRLVLTRNQLRTDGDMCIYALTVSTMEPRIVKEAMTDPAWIDSMQKELLQFKRLDVWVLVPAPDNIKPLTLKWLFKNKLDEENTIIRNKTRLVVRGYRQEEGIDF